MADKTMAELIAEAPHELHEAYSLIGGLDQLLAPSDNPLVHMQKAIDDANFKRAQVQYEGERRAREQRKAKLAEAAEARAAEAHARDERERAEAEAQLMARLRREFPACTDTAWNSMWPQIRADHFHAEHKRRMAALENDGVVFGEMAGTHF